ncbi:MAG: acetolactate synthase small subunit [Spirochaetales bacterium]|nr:acetolactate synthase small subunit [Spirochaetales bacterium]
MDNGAQKHAISLYVANKPGVLIRISLVFARRGYNIDSLVVSEAHDPDFSRMNIEASGDKRTLDQILHQLNKLVDVVHAKDNTGEDVIAREFTLIKVQCPSELRAEVLLVAHAFESETVDLSEDTITLQISGESRKMDSIHTVFNKYGVLEMVRSGKIIIARGSHRTS